MLRLHKKIQDSYITFAKKDGVFNPLSENGYVDFINFKGGVTRVGSEKIDM
jgi:hypothetical protein